MADSPQSFPPATSPLVVVVVVVVAAMYIDVRDHLRNSVQVTFSLDSTFGDVRNAVNCCLPHGFVVTEFELVPAPFAHYIEDDPEAFKGPSDEWYIVDVFFDEIAAGLRRIEEDPNADQLVVCLRLVSIAPLRAGKG